MKRHRYLMVIFFLAVLLNISAFSYILWSGYFGDDAQNVDLPGRAMLAGQTWLQLSQHAASEWVFKTGRPFPLSVYTVPLFHLFSSRIAYKVFILILSLLSFFSFSLLIYRVSKNIRLALLYLLFLPCFVSSRYWYDPLLSFAGLIPLLIFYLSLSLTLFWESLSFKGTHPYRIGSIILFYFALLTYEISEGSRFKSYPFFASPAALEPS